MVTIENLEQIKIPNIPRFMSPLPEMSLKDYLPPKHHKFLCFMIGAWNGLAQVIL